MFFKQTCNWVWLSREGQSSGCRVDTRLGRFALTCGAALAGLLVVGACIGCNPHGSGKKTQDTPRQALPIASAAVRAWGAGVASTDRTAPTGSEELEWKDTDEGSPRSLDPPQVPLESDGEDIDSFGAPDSQGADGGGDGGDLLQVPDGSDRSVPLPSATGKSPVVAL